MFYIVTLRLKLLPFFSYICELMCIFARLIIHKAGMSVGTLNINE